MPEVLDAHKISWKVYGSQGAIYLPSSPLSMLASNNRLLYLKQYQDPSSPLHRNAFGWTFPNDFARDVTNDTLPSVSWLVACGHKICRSTRLRRPPAASTTRTK
jgi:phospholipase C